MCEVHTKLIATNLTAISVFIYHWSISVFLHVLLIGTYFRKTYVLFNY